MILHPIPSAIFLITQSTEVGGVIGLLVKSLTLIYYRKKDSRAKPGRVSFKLRSGFLGMVFIFFEYLRVRGLEDFVLEKD